MTVKCAKCGEELLGAVNRCWRCGTKVESGGQAGPQAALRAEPAGGNRGALQDDADDVVVATLVQRPTLSDSNGAPARMPGPRSRPLNLRRLSAAQGGAIAALMLGLMSVIASFYTVLAAIPAALGLALGVWGLFSPRRGPAILGLLLCCLALAVASFNGAVAMYRQAYGHAPWETPAEQAEPTF